MSSPVQGNVIPANGIAPNPFSLAVDTSNGLVYAPTQGSPGLQQLVVIGDSYTSWLDSARVDVRTNFPHQSSYGAFDPANGRVYVADYGSGDISVYNGADGHFVDLISLGTSWVYGVLYVPSTDFLYATELGRISVINVTTDSVVSRTYAGNGDQGMTFDPSTRNIFVSSYGTWMGDNGSISVFSTSTNTVVRTIDFPPAPYFTYIQNVFFASDGYLYALGFNFWGGQHAAETLYKINPRAGTILASIHAAIVDSNSGQIAQDPLGRIYITSGNFIQVFDPTNGTFVGNIGAGLETTGIAYDPFTGDMLATNLVSGTISVIPTGVRPHYFRPVTLTESGLANGTSWGAGNQTLNQSTNGSQIRFVLPAGNYRFTARPPPTYLSQGVNFAVDTQPVKINLVFQVTQKVTTTTSTQTTSALSSALLSTTSQISTFSSTTSFPQNSGQGASPGPLAIPEIVQIAAVTGAVVFLWVAAALQIRRSRLMKSSYTNLK